MTKARFPDSVYGSGEEPDPRFSMANERTFLAWIRTSLAFIAGGVALETFELPLNTTLTRVVSVIMLLVAIVLPAVAWLHWGASERAMRHSRPLPASPALALVVAVVTVIGVMILVGELLA
ncbi:YidH family protein [Corynebacterium minutissimum]|uniref:YidH family protein n=1 Tax=Corynebacterium minutissimum TaxID=38301 RepID=UPI001EF30BBB|nr:DUF202 domain-containing protein [Corynebacterium minutissimum]MCG7228447.1 DUF202 domain-containing protein [Corynebacterium minutissimum]MCG7237565.1 DUF202 domain-containing protein [Corynebacterium minutissimum]